MSAKEALWFCSRNFIRVKKYLIEIKIFVKKVSRGAKL